MTTSPHAWILLAALAAAPLGLAQGSAAPAEPDARVVNTYAGGKLVRVTRIYQAEHANLNDFVADFRAVQARLAAEHGTPAEDVAIWLDDSYQEEPISYLEQDRARATDILPSDRFSGIAVLLGHLKLYVKWVENGSEIIHTLASDGSRIVHQVEYTNPAPAAHSGD